jgi:hypothetical protein
MTATITAPQSIESLLGQEAEDLLTYKAKVPKEMLHLPGPDFVDRIFTVSDRQLDNIFGVKVHRIWGKRSPRRVLDTLIYRQN